MDTDVAVGAILILLCIYASFIKTADNKVTVVKFIPIGLGLALLFFLLI